MGKLIKCALIVICGCLTACSHDDTPEYPVLDMDETTLSSQVAGEGGNFTLSFTVNTSWRIEGPDNVTISPRTGSMGNNTVVITLPMNPSSTYYARYDFSIYTNDGDFISSFSIQQEPAPYIECEEDVITLEQCGNREAITVKASKEPTVSCESSWITTELEKTSDISGNTYCLRIEATENPDLEGRSTNVTLSVGSLKKEITVNQIGGVLLKHELLDASGNIVKDMDGSGYNYSIPPQGGSYTLNVHANTSWTVSKSDTWWSENFSYSQTAKNDNSATFLVSVSELNKNASADHATLIFSFSDGVKREIQFIQNTWGISIYVNKGESLSEQIDKVRPKLSEGYFIDYISINGGDIDTYAPSTVRSVSISNVDNIREGFCERCDNLTSLTMSNVKKIGARAFIGHNLNSISIPATVTYIGDRAFMKTIWYPYVTCYNPNPPTLGTWVFHDGIGDGVLKVPMGSAPKYKANSLWSKQFSSYEEF